MHWSFEKYRFTDMQIFQTLHISLYSIKKKITIVTVATEVFRKVFKTWEAVKLTVSKISFKKTPKSE